MHIIDEVKINKVLNLLNMCCKVNGLNKREAESIVIYFKQGILSDRLDYDGLRGIRENLPYVIPMLCVSLGLVSDDIDGLLNAASNKQVTYDVLTKSILDNEERIAKDYKSKGWWIL